MHSGHIVDFIIFLSAVIVFIPIFQYLKINPLLAFIGAGLVIGPYDLKLVKTLETAEVIGEIGLIFLLFTIGLEISFKRLKTMRKYLLGVGSLQVCLTTIALSFVCYMLTKNAVMSVVIGYGLAMSSTAVALRMVQDRGELSTTYGRATVGTLLFQDLAVIPLMVLIPKLASNNDSLWLEILLSLLKAGVAIVLIWIVGSLVIKPIFKIVANTKIVEAFSALVLLIVIGMAMLTGHIELSLELGAFIAGMLLAETEYVHQIEADINPYSGLLLGIFFLYVGMTIKIPYVIDNFGIILLFTLLLMVIKGVILYLIGKRFKINNSGSFMLAAAMSQSSEFGFLVFLIAQKNGIIEVSIQDKLQAIISMSMAFTPIVFAVTRRILQSKDESDKAPSKVLMTETSSEYKEHILVVGYGRSGQFISRILKSKGVNVCAIDSDINKISEAHKDDINILYGNATRPKILRAGGAMDAKCIIVAIADSASTNRVLATLKFYFSDIPVYVLATDNAISPVYIASGALNVVPKLEEGCLELVSKILRINGIRETEISEMVFNLRSNNYCLSSSKE